MDGFEVVLWVAASVAYSDWDSAGEKAYYLADMLAAAKAYYLAVSMDAHWDGPMVAGTAAM